MAVRLSQSLRCVFLFRLSIWSFLWFFTSIYWFDCLFRLCLLPLLLTLDLLLPLASASRLCGQLSSVAEPPTFARITCMTHLFCHSLSRIFLLTHRLTFLRFFLFDSSFGFFFWDLLPAEPVFGFSTSQRTNNKQQTSKRREPPAAVLRLQLVSRTFSDMHLVPRTLFGRQLYRSVLKFSCGDFSGGRVFY